MTDAVNVTAPIHIAAIDRLWNPTHGVHLFAANAPISALAQALALFAVKL